MTGKGIINKPEDMSVFGHEPKSLIVLFLIIILGAALRVYDLGAESYWIDEIMVIDSAQRSMKWIIFESWRPPVFPFLAHFWIKIFGTSEVATRSLSAITGLASLGLMYAVSRQLFGTTVGHISTFIMAISEFLIYYSQEFRHYSVFVFFTLLSFLFYIRALKYKRMKDFVFYVPASLLMFYTHTYGAFVLTSQILYMLFRWNRFREARALWILTQVLILIGISPALLAVAIKTMAGRGPGMEWIPDPPNWAPVRVLLIYLFHRFYYYLSSPLIILRNALPAIALFCGGTLIYAVSMGKEKWLASAGNLFRKTKERQDQWDEIILVALWLCCTILIPFVFSKIFGPFYFFRYTICAAPAFFLLMALGITCIEKVVPKIISLGTLVLLVIPGLHYYYTKPVNEQWREAAAYIKENSGGDDVIATVESYSWGYNRKTFTWYYKGLLKMCSLDRSHWDDKTTTETFTRCISGSKNVWLIFRESNLKSNQYFKEILLNRVLADTHMTKEIKFEGLSVYVLSVKKQ